MNKITMTINKDQKFPDPFNSELEISPEVEESWKKVFDELLAIEILQAERTVLENGMIRYRLNIPEYKQNAIRKAFSNVILKDVIDQKNS